MSFHLYTTPTPLERAYAEYLLQHCFPSTRSLPISGRHAVVFLTTSGLPRNLLREIWNIVDPNQDGKLAEEKQWWTCLKLVALAQQQNCQGGVEVLLQHLHTTVTPLPVFSNVILPTPEFLLSQYSSSGSLGGEGLDVNVPTSVDGALTLSGAIPSQQEQVPFQQTVAPVDFNVPKETKSWAAALEELGPIEDAPLPSLTNTNTQTNENDEESEDEFGTFENAPEIVEQPKQEESVEPMPPPLPVYTYTAPIDFDAPKQVKSLEDALEELGPIEDAPLPSLGAAAATVEVEQQKVDEDDTDDFGDFEAPKETATSNDDPLSTASQNEPLTEEASVDVFSGFNQSAAPDVVPLSSALDELGPIEDAPLPSLTATIERQQVTEDEEEDDFGDFEAPKETAVDESVPLPTDQCTTDVFSGFNQNATPSVVPLSSALDELGPIEDAPLPSLTDATVEPQQAEEDEDDDNFGDFEAPKEVAVDESVPLPTDECTTRTDVFEGFNQNPTPAIVPLSSALDELGPIEDAPLPPLTATVEPPQQVEEDDEKDDFGDFEAPKEVAVDESAPPPTDETSADVFEGFNQSATPAIVPLSSALDELGPIEDAPLPSLTDTVDPPQQQEDEEDDDFGDFEAPKEASLSLDVFGPVEDALLPSLDTNHRPPEEDKTDAFNGFHEAAIPVLPLSSALDELGSSHDAPLPSLDTFAVNDGQQDGDDNDDDDEDFCGFQDAPSNDNAVTTAALPEEEGEPAQDEPVSTIHVLSEAEKSVEFTAPVQTQLDDEEDEIKNEDPMASAFEALGPVEDKPLPPLGTGVHETAPQSSGNDEDDEWGDFEAPTDMPEGAVGDALSPALDTVDQSQDAPLPSLGVTKSQPQESGSVSRFGNFDVQNRTETVDDPLSSAFEGLGPALDAPLPSLESHAQDFAINEEANENNQEAGSEEDVAELSNTALSSALHVLEPIQDSSLSSQATRTQVQEDNETFGDFDNAQPTEVVSDEAASAAMSKTIVDDDPFASAFGAVAPVENSPLPSLGMHKVVNDYTTGDDETTPEDDFGDFECPSAVESSEDVDNLDVERLVTDKPTQAKPAGLAASTDSSNPFSSAFDMIAPVEDTPLPTLGASVSTEEFEGPSGQTETAEAESSASDAIAIEKDIQEFDTAKEVSQKDVLGQETEADAGDLFSDATGPLDAPLSTFQSASGSDLSGFETASENIYSEEKKGEADMFASANDDFGSFSGPKTKAPSTNTAEEGPTDAQEAEMDDFGDFTAVEAPSGAADAFDAEWGDFEEPSGPETIERKLSSTEVPLATPEKPDQPIAVDAGFGFLAPASGGDDDFGDFGSFQQVEHPTEKEETLDDIKSRVQEMQKKLTIKTTKGGQIDFVKSFEENVQSNKRTTGRRLGFNKNAPEPQDAADSLLRGRRCCQVMTLLTTSNGHSTDHWEKVLNAARDELAMGAFLLEEAKGISGEEAVVSALRTWVAGLGEYVRVTRSVAATLCDLLGLCVTIEADQMRNQLKLLDSAMEVEELWINVEGAAKGFDIAVPKLESVSDIRRKSLDRFSNDNLCQLTLQPLSEEDNGTTKNPVEWDGRFFMACAANFWANRVSTNVPM